MVEQEELRELSNDELLALVKRRYREAQDDGTLIAIKRIAETLGQCVNSRHRKYCYNLEGIEVYVDNYGGYLTVEVGGVQACSTHDCDRYIIPGDWISRLMAQLPLVDSMRDKKMTERQLQERRALLKKLQFLS